MSHQAVAVPAPPSTKPPQWKSWLSLENRYIPPLFITLILLIGHLTYGILESYPKTLTAIGTAIAMELVLGKIFTGKFPNLASAYISGISVGILLRSPAFWPYALGAAISITSKYVLRFKGRHLWNPSNFGICVMIFLAAESVATLSIQWGNNLWPHDRNLAAGLDDCVACEAPAHQRNVCDLLLCPRLSARRDHA